jgi:hypothetical protein
MSRKSKESIDNKTEKEKKIYTDNEIKEKLGSDYIFIHPSLYDHVPRGDYIRYFKVGTGPKNERFNIGAFVQGVAADESGRKYFILSKQLFGANKKVYRLYYNAIDTLYKKYHYASYIEIHLISSSLAEKKQQIKQLMEVQKVLLAKIDELRADINILKQR